MTNIVVARPSATVVLAREAAGAPELFMVRRHAQSSFGAAYAFPGGVIDEEDAGVDQYCDGRDGSNANEVLGLTSGGNAFFVGAIRELFEETGVLLAACDRTQEDLEMLRADLNSNNASWSDFLRMSGARMLCDRLTYFAHWITPNEMARRYTTRFFAAELPHGQIAKHDAGELTDSAWITAADALQGGQKGTMKLHYPTVKTLESIAHCETLDALFAWASHCEANGVVAIQPVPPAGATE